MLLNALSEKCLFAPLKTDIDVTGVSCDSRTIEKGFVFVALSGVKTDGAVFVKDAVAKGAAVVIAGKNEKITDCPVPVITVDDPRRVMALLATAMNEGQPETVVAVTGTNGKTSTANFFRQIFEASGQKSASVGTLGVITAAGTQYGSMTTPDPVTLHKILSSLKRDGITACAMEASSHGLDQHRLDGIRLCAAGFTNITRDHLDYHKTMENYLQAKLKLFEMPLSSKTVVLNADIAEFPRIKAFCEEKGLRVFDYGRHADVIRLEDNELDIKGQTLKLRVFDKKYVIRLPLAGTFQAMNALCALGLALAAGANADAAVDALTRLKGTNGRLEHIADRFNGAGIYVDYAHTPDAIETVLNALRPHTQNRLHIVFGCGGDRDTGKRPQMGALAQQLADAVYVTDDNPRSEEPVAIRNAILPACPKAIDAGHRSLAIETAVRSLKKGDVLVVAGKGHEIGQMIKGINHPFDDKDEIRKAVAKADAPLWTTKEIAAATHGTTTANVDIHGISINSRDIQPADLYIALKGEKLDGHAFAKAATDAGAAAVLVTHAIDGIPSDRQIIVDDTQKALEAMAAYARARTRAKIIGITGSSGKTSTKEMMRCALSAVGVTHATQGNLNNGIGMPLTLARLPKDADFAVIEMGMNHAGELTAMSALCRPDAVAVTMIGKAHCEFFKDERATATAKSEIFSHMNTDGVVFLNKDDAQYDFLRQKALEYGVKNVFSFGETDGCDVRAIDISEKTTVTTKNGTYTYSLRLPGRHQAHNSLAVIGICEYLGVDMTDAVSGLAQTPVATGRGDRTDIPFNDGVISVLDDAYNANPDSMAAALRVLGTYKNRRKIAVLGNMGELGDKSLDLHKGLSPVIISERIDKVVAVGDLTAALYGVLPDSVRGFSVADAHEAACHLPAFLQAGDVVLVKGSHSAHMDVIVAALKTATTRK